MRQWERSGRYMLVWAACIALLLFYTIPVSALQAILQINTLEEVRRRRDGFKNSLTLLCDQRDVVYSGSSTYHRLTTNLPWCFKHAATLARQR